MSFHTVAKVGDIPDDTGVCVDVAGRKIALFHQDGSVFALDNECPHEGGPLYQGFYEDRIVTCPLHAWDFDVTTGRVKGGVERVDTFPVRVDDDGTIHVSVD
jgi:NAD(P)H-dependent nitrite reductase small subunit